MDSSFLLSEDLNIAVILYLFVWYFAHSLFLPLNELNKFLPGRTGKPGVLQFMESQRAEHDLATEQQLPLTEKFRVRGSQGHRSPVKSRRVYLGAHCVA